MYAAFPLILALAAVSLLLPWEPVYDPWGWLVWGREVSELALDTTSGPSWKPLPVVFTAPFSLAGDAAPELWLVVARAGWLAAAALAGLLAARVAERGGAGRRERLVAGAIAAAGIVLLFDEFTPWLRQFAGGLAEPLMVALVLAAVERGLAGRHRAALALGAAAALVRPEAWPALLVYGWWLWRGRPEERRAVAVAAAALAALWFIPDLLGSGSFLTGADRAREGSGSPPVEALEVLVRAAALPLAALWGGFAAALVMARRRGDRPLLAVAWGSLGWIALVAAMAAGGYAGLPRFLAPAAAVATALGAAGLVRLTTRTTGTVPSVPMRALAVALAVAFLVQGGFRVADLDNAARAANDLSALREELAAIVDDAGAERIRDCGETVIGAIEGQTQLAWLLEVPIADVDVSKTPPAEGTYFERLPDGWRLVELGCPNMARP